jgi:hypothetical protein
MLILKLIRMLILITSNPSSTSNTNTTGTTTATSTTAELSYPMLLLIETQDGTTHDGYDERCMMKLTHNVNHLDDVDDEHDGGDRDLQPQNGMRRSKTYREHDFNQISPQIRRTEFSQCMSNDPVLPHAHVIQCWQCQAQAASGTC